MYIALALYKMYLDKNSDSITICLPFLKPQNKKYLSNKRVNEGNIYVQDAYIVSPPAELEIFRFLTLNRMFSLSLGSLPSILPVRLTKEKIVLIYNKYVYIHI